MALTPSNGMLNGMLSDALAGVLSDCDVMLFINSPILNEDSVLADLTPATYTGYAPVPVSFSTPYKDAAGNYVVETYLLSFQPSGTTNLPQQMVGCAVRYDVGGTPKLLCAQVFEDQPVFTSVLSNKSFVARVQIPNSEVFGDVAELN